MSDNHDLSVERILDAPLDAVWRAWTGHLAEWFCPPPWRAELIEQDLRPGGRSAMVMRGPNGEENHLEGVVLEVVTRARVVTTDAFAAGWRPQRPLGVRIDTFADAGDGQTHYTATARHWTAQDRDRHAAMGFEQGWSIAADQLEQVARRLA